MATAAAPPPIPAAAMYFVAVNGQQTGPFDAATISQKIARREIAPETLVWKQGMSAWSQASLVDELKSFFGSVPPPVPK